MRTRLLFFFDECSLEVFRLAKDRSRPQSWQRAAGFPSGLSLRVEDSPRGLTHCEIVASCEDPRGLKSTAQ